MKITFKLLVTFIVSFSLTSISGYAQTFQQQKVANNIYMLQGGGGNIVIITGEDGLIMIDNGLDRTKQALQEALKSFSQAPNYIINTHHHYDHSGANKVLGQDSTIVAHNNVRKRLEASGNEPSHGLPTLTFNDSVTLFVNGFTINIEYSGIGHTDGDSIVYIEQANVVHMGDHFFSGYFPFVDINSGGSLNGYMENVQRVIDRIDSQTKIIPGHGKLSNKQDLVDYYEMMKTTKTIVEGYIKKGLSLEQSIEKGLPEKWKPWGAFFINETKWITLLYKELNKETTLL